MGEVTGFVLSIGDAPGVYLSGDTVWYPAIAEIARRFEIGLAVLVAGSAQPRGTFNVTMNTNDALEAAAVFSKAEIMSVHNISWSHYTQSQEDRAKAFDAVGQRGRFHHLTPGVAVAFEV